MLNKNQKDFWAGILFVIFGIGTVVVAQENALGTLSRMGPAYFPTILGAMLALMKKGVHPILIICMSAVGGVVFGFALHLLV